MNCPQTLQGGNTYYNPLFEGEIKSENVEQGNCVSCVGASMHIRKKWAFEVERDMLHHNFWTAHNKSIRLCTDASKNPWFTFEFCFQYGGHFLHEPIVSQLGHNYLLAIIHPKLQVLTTKGFSFMSISQAANSEVWSVSKRIPVKNSSQTNLSIQSPWLSRKSFTLFHDLWRIFLSFPRG